MYAVYLMEDGYPQKKIGCFATERLARAAAAKALGTATLRGLTQVPSTGGTVFYGRGADDYSGLSVEVRP